MLQSLADPLRCITEDWPEPHFFLNAENLDTASERFVANLYPSVSSLLDAHRAYFDRLFVQPARDANAEHWGFKEVRLSADYAHYLKLLYPNSKFLFLIRNPYDAYRSWAARRNAGWKWFYRWPDQPVTARLFGRVWCELAGSFAAEAEQLGAHVVRYEDLKAGQYEQIESYLGFPLNRAAAGIRPDDGPKPIEFIPHAELAELGDEMHELAETLGYADRTMDLQVGGDAKETNATGAQRVAEPDLDPARCVVLVPIGGQVVPACEEGLAELERRGYPVRRVRGYSAIDQGRNQMATDAMAEDFAFCERARQAGFKIHADTSVRLMHYGNYGYSWEDAGMELQRYRTFHFHTK